MASTLHKAKASVVKVSIGPSTGHRVARIIRAGGVIPEGVELEQLDSLVKRGLIETFTVPDAADIEAAATAAADAEKARLASEAKATADAKAASDAKAKSGTPAK